MSPELTAALNAINTRIDSLAKRIDALEPVRCPTQVEQAQDCSKHPGEHPRRLCWDWVPGHYEEIVGC